MTRTKQITFIYNFPSGKMADLAHIAIMGYVIDIGYRGAINIITRKNGKLVLYYPINKKLSPQKLKRICDGFNPINAKN